jgi:hypothetical protein
MNDNEAMPSSSPLRRQPWNKGKLIGAKPPLRASHVWTIRTKMQLGGRNRDLALFNLAIDSKLRGCAGSRATSCLLVAAARAMASRHANTLASSGGGSPASASTRSSSARTRYAERRRR